MGLQAGLQNHLGRSLGSAPLSTAYALVLLATTLVLRRVAPTTAGQLLTASSTDVAHLGHDPVAVLLLSASWLPAKLWLPEAFVLFLIAVPLERRIGAMRTGLVFLSGHVIATLLTELPIGAAIAAGWLPPDDAHRIDVGASYGLMAVIVASIGGLTLTRGLAVFVLAGELVVGIPTELDMATYGHLLAAAIGVCWWPYLHHRCSWRTVFRPRPRRREIVATSEPIPAQDLTRTRRVGSLRHGATSHSAAWVADL